MWREALRRAALANWSPGTRGTIVVVAPHPDDETLGLAGPLSDLTRRGWGVRLVLVTDGEAAYPGAAELSTIRLAELSAALTHLGLSSAATLCRLGLPDGAVAEHSDVLQRRLAPLVSEASWVLAPWPEDGHPDHDAVGRAARHVARTGGTPIRFYPIWAWHWAAPDTPWGDRLLSRAERYDLSPEAVVAKRRAIGAFESQRDGLLGPPILPDQVLAHFLRPFEVVLA